MGQAAATVVIPDDFRMLFRGDVLLPADGEAYERARFVFNGAIDKHPGVIFMCAGTSDVARAVRLARALQLGIHVRGQGHGVEGSGAGRRQALVWVQPHAQRARGRSGPRGAH